MSKKDKRKYRQEMVVALSWWKRAGARLTLIPVATIVSILTLAYTYKTTGANELRSEVYQPLYADVLSAEQSIQAVSTENAAFMTAFQKLRRSGAFERVPASVQKRLVKISEDASTIYSAINSVREIAIREMSAQIIKIRTEQGDRIWQMKAESALREMSKSKKGFADTVNLLSRMNHEARSRSIDVSRPNQPQIAGPGGPTFVVRDWLTYPESIRTIEELWTEVDYLYFNDRIDSWYYQITRDDLKQQNTTLDDFLRPVFSILSENSDFQLLLKQRPVILTQLKEIKADLEDRIQDPKQLGDLVLF